MRLVEVDVVGLQALQRPVDRLEDVLARQPAVVRTGAGRPEHLGEDLEALTPFALQCATEHRLRLRAGVDVSGVESRDAVVERGAHARERLLLLDLAAVRDPVAVGNLADEQAAPAEVSMLHALDAMP